MAYPVTGVVVNSGGKPVAGARLYFTASPAPQPDVAMLADATGGFTLAVNAPGQYRIAAASDEHGKGELAFEAPVKGPLRIIVSGKQP